MTTPTIHRCLEPMEQLTFKDLVALEPRLQPLLDEARSYHQNTAADFCANAVWYGYFDSRGLKERMSRLVGYEVPKSVGILSTEEAYDVAYDTIYQALPNCRACGCFGHPSDTTVPKFRFDHRLLCYVKRLTYEFNTRTGRLDMPEHNCCDMTGAIALFQAIDPKVRFIETFAGGVSDTSYRRQGDKWEAVDRRK
jgi:hypothetical protein